MEIKLGDYFGGDNDIRAKIKMKDVAKELDPSFKIDEKNLTYIYTPQVIAGKYFMIKGYGFRECAWGYECLITPQGTFADQMETYKSATTFIPKASGDRSKNYYTRYKTKYGGKEEFNPVSKTGGREEISETKRRLGL